jgi:hypothetical protein
MNGFVEDASSRRTGQPEEAVAANEASATARMAKQETAPASPTTAAEELASRRSRSRGRTPSELLARKQRLLSGARSATSKLDSADRQDQEQAFSSAAGDQSAEAKLESLSVILRNHQVSSSLDELIMTEEDEANKMAKPNVNGKQQNGSTNTSITTATAATPTGVASSQPQDGQLKSVDDVYILLAKKEKDLQLAAELGKVLLERNEDLSRANERMAEEYSHKLEVSSCGHEFWGPSAVIGSADHGGGLTERRPGAFRAPQRPHSV